MASTAPALSESPAMDGSPPRARGRVVEFLAVGGASLLLLPLGWLLRAGVGLDAAELAVGFTAFHAAHLINDPHFAVTYLLFYSDAKQRAVGSALPPALRIRYVLMGFVAPALLAGWAVWGLASESAPVLGGLVQLMFLLVGWHYVKQGFGVYAVLSARRGLAVPRAERLAVLAHCYAGWAFAWASPATPGRDVSEKGVVYAQVARPEWLELATGGAFFASAALLAAALLWGFVRERRVPPLAPLTGLLVTVWLWTVYSSIDPLMIYLIPALHSVQYLYFVTLLRRNRARAEQGPPLFGRPPGTQLAVLGASAVALGWLLLRGAPDFFDGVVFARGEVLPGEGLGPTPYFAALFAFVNIHHYLMDTVLWRRENPETRFLRD